MSHGELIILLALLLVLNIPFMIVEQAGNWFGWSSYVRFFLMSPLHHHYQKKGYKEPKIVLRFFIVGILLAVITLATLKLR